MPIKNPLTQRWNNDSRLDPGDANMMVSQAYNALRMGGASQKPDPEEDKKKKLLEKYGFAAYDLMVPGTAGEGGGGTGW